jgi:hypothetical protein
MRVHRLIGTALATLGVAGGGLAFTAAPALAELTHPYLPQSTITGSNPPSEVFSKLTGVAVEPSGAFWIADNANANVAVYKFSSNGAYQGIKLTEAGNPPATFEAVQGIVTRPGGGVFVIDNTSKVINMFSASGAYEGQFNGIFTPQREFKSVFGIGVAANGTLWIGNNTSLKVVDKFSSTGTYENFQLTEAGNPLTALGAITSVAVRANDGILVGDNAKKLVDEFSAGGAYEAQLPVPTNGRPTALAIAAPSKRIAIGDSLNKVVDEFSDAGVLEGHTAVPAINGIPSEVVSDGVAYGPNESLIVTDKKNSVVDFFGPPIKTLTAKTGGATPQVTTATVLGEVNPEGVDASGFFEYGLCTTPTTCLSSPYGQTATALVEGTQNSVFGNGSQYVKVEATLKGLQPNKTYHYRLVGHNTYGDFPATNSAELKTLPSKPVIEGQQALFVTLTTAELAGVVNPENEATTMKFEYGPCADAQSCATSPYSSKTVSASVGEGFGGTTLYSEVEALTPATTYHYRVVAKNLTGTSESAEGTFATPAIPPTVTPPAGSAPQAVAVTPTGIGTSTATLNGEVDPNNVPTTYRFELALGGPTAASAIVALGEAGSGSDAVPVSLTVESLQPGTEYTYWLIATNAYGWSTSAATVFTTVGFPAAFTQPIALSLLVTPSVALPKEPAKVTPRRLTRAQKLARALRACAKQPKSKRAACRRAAQKRYGPVKTKAKKK